MSAGDRLLTPEAAQTTVLEQIRVLGVERVPLLEALGRVLAAPVAAAYDSPPSDNSAMDGFAVRAADLVGAGTDRPVALEVIEDIPAGRVGQRRVGPGQASRIMTGAPVPEGADTVVRVEDTRPAGDRVEVLDAERLGANIRRRGEELAKGAPVLAAGTACGPAELAVLAAQQRAFVPVYRRPSVAILSTGDELVDLDEPLAPGRIVNSNTYGLAAMTLAHGGTPVLMPIVRDRPEEIRAAIETGLAADVLLSSGGVSVGEYDYVKQVLHDLGARPGLWRVAMKPGKPLFFCVLQGRPYFGLPGNPASSLVSFLQFVRPAIRKASGHPAGDLLLPSTRATTETPLSNPGDRRYYLRARLRYERGRLSARALAPQGSHMLTSMLGANGLILLEPEERADAGDEVTVQIIDRVF